MASFLLADGTFDWSKILASIGGAAATGIFTFIIWWLNRKRPNIIECRETSVLSLLRIPSSIRPNVHVRFKEEPVANLAQLGLQLRNIGGETMKDIKLNLSFSEDTRVLQYATSSIECDVNQPSPHEIEIHLPFLNPFDQHKEFLDIIMLCDGTVEGLRVRGRGEGWSVRHVTANAIIKKGLRKFTTVNASLLALYVILSFSYMFTIEMVTGMPANEVSLRSLVYGSPVLVFGAAAVAIALWTGRRMGKQLDPLRMRKS